MRRQSRPAAGLLLLLLVVALVLGCRQEVPPLFRRNQPPETTLTVVPADSAFGFYRYHVYWRGEDSDGRVVRYIFAITDTLSRNEEENWDPERFEDRDRSSYTEKTDSVFVFDSARGRQAFNIASIDDFGRTDPTPARSFFRIVDNGLPTVVFLGVQGFRGDTVLPPCGIASECTIPTFTSFKVHFTGSTPNGRITGFQWQSIKPAETDPEPIQPEGADSLFFGAGRDTTVFVFGSTTDTLWTANNDVITVFYYNERGDSTRTIAPGNFTFRARVRDEASNKSLFNRGTTRVVLNHDPDTRLYRIAARDCPRCAGPNPPAYCSSNDSLVAGFLSGFERSAIADTSQWILFCDGDTIPKLSHVRFYARGHDDSRDVPIDPAGLRNVGFSARFAWTNPSLSNKTMPFSVDTTAVQGDYHLPDGTPWSGWVNGWGNATEYQGICPFDFSYYVAAVDEHGKRDGTPDSLSFYTSGSPIIDSLVVPKVIVLAPTCGLFPGFCPDLTGITFGPDTLMLVGTNIAADPPNPARASNRFGLTFRAYGHDHPRDSNPLINPDNWGRILSWLFRFTCTGANCQDIALPGEGQWRNDSYDQNVFDDTLQVTFAVDTLCTASPCGFSYKIVLPSSPLGPYEFTIQGQDVSSIGETCREPSDLGPTASPFTRQVSQNGRLTQEVTRNLILRQLQDVRPYVPRATAEARSRTPRKGWWKR
jgi:hypothetical protein